MIVDENEEPCSAKYLANEILLRCLENIGSYLAENVPTLDKLTERERLALNVQLIKQVTRLYKLLGVHPDDIGERFDPDKPWNSNMVDGENYLVDKNGDRIVVSRQAPMVESETNEQDTHNIS